MQFENNIVIHNALIKMMSSIKTHNHSNERGTTEIFLLVLKPLENIADFILTKIKIRSRQFTVACYLSKLDDRFSND